MAERMARQRNHQHVSFAVAERAHALIAEAILAALDVEIPVRAVLPLAGDVTYSTSR
jgi:hypothetical protein